MNMYKVKQMLCGIMNFVAIVNAHHYFVDRFVWKRI